MAPIERDGPLVRPGRACEQLAREFRRGCLCDGAACEAPTQIVMIVVASVR